MDKTFYVEGFGEVGSANLEGFAAFKGFKQPSDLEVSEKSEGRMMNTTSDKKPMRVTRRS